MPPQPPASLRVLIVEDDADIRESTGMLLRRHGYDVRLADGGRAGLEQVLTDPPDIAIVDIAMPDLDGITLTRRIKESGDLPVILLTARDLPSDVVHGLDAGADDYVTKPYSSRELVARVRAVLRRQGEQEEPMSATISAGPVRMDVERHVVSVDGEQVSLPLKEFELLEMLLRNAGRVLTRGQLIDRVWGSDYVGDTKTLDVHVKRLRSKIEPDPSSPRYLVTVRGLGYKFEA